VLLVYLSLHEEMSLLAFMNELVKIVVSYVLDNCSCSSIGVGAALAIQAVVFVVVIIVVVVPVHPGFTHRCFLSDVFCLMNLLVIF